MSKTDAGSAASKQNPQQLIRPEVLELSAYAVPDASGLIKLDAMENPYQWSPELKAQWLQGMNQLELNRYPDPRGAALTAQIKKSFDIPACADVMLGNGSDELIQVIINAIAKPDAVVMSLSPGFVMYEYISLFSHLDYQAVKLDENFAIDLPLMLQQIASQQPAVIFIAYPNNPTGNLFDRAAINAIINAAPGLVVVDEAYAAFSAESYMHELEQHANLLVLRTVSKMGLAGLRLGYLCGAPQWLEQLDKVRLPYNINILTQYTCRFALQHKEELDKQTEQIRIDREWLIAEMKAVGGIEVFPSQANFILFRTTDGLADKLFKQLLDNKILIKNMSHAGPQLKNCLRVTVGMREQCEKFLAVLEAQ